MTSISSIAQVAVGNVVVAEPTAFHRHWTTSATSLCFSRRDSIRAFGDEGHGTNCVHSPVAWGMLELVDVAPHQQYPLLPISTRIIIATWSHRSVLGYLHILINVLVPILVLFTTRATRFSTSQTLSSGTLSQELAWCAPWIMLQLHIICIERTRMPSAVCLQSPELGAYLTWKSSMHAFQWAIGIYFMSANPSKPLLGSQCEIPWDRL